MEPLLHFSHFHPLFLSEGNNITINGSDDCEGIVCEGCKLNISSSTQRYSCKFKRCSFFLHKTCAELPKEIELPILHKTCAKLPKKIEQPILHPQTLVLRSPPIEFSTCKVCDKWIKEFMYQCNLCEFSIDIICARRIQHYSQKHPLALRELVEGPAGSCCFVCSKPIKITKGSSYIYRCTTCDLYSHKFCAELLTEELKKHGLHPEHSLILLPIPLPSSFICAACDQYVRVIGYRCSHSDCNFSLHPSCALRLQSVEINECHKHALTPLLNTALFHCHGCGEEHEGPSYLCNTCGFWIHEDCVSFPTTITHHNHCHPLNRCFSDRKPRAWCNVCEEDLYKNSWIYRCERRCSFCIHVKCSTKTRKRKTTIRVEDLQVINPIRLPMADNSINPIDRFMSQPTNITGTEMFNQLQAESAGVNHFSHIHPLILFNVQVDSNLCSGSKILVSSEHYKDETIICDACVRPIISSPFYGCTDTDCNFFLHDYCAKLNEVLKHPYHQHKLNLVGKRPSYCNGCFQHCNGFIFKCPNCKDFCLDVKCALLPYNIIHQEHPLHEDHEQPLYLRRQGVSEGCIACDKHEYVFSYGCDICSFTLHYYCAMLPRTIRHRYDKHPFTLICAPIPDGPDQYVCEFCEDDIDTRWWFYHCILCDKSACVKCIFKKEREYPIVKWGSKYKTDGHEHPLTLVQPTKKSPLCSECNKTFDDKNLEAFECSVCDAIFHLTCVCRNFWGEFWIR